MQVTKPSWATHKSQEYRLTQILRLNGPQVIDSTTLKRTADKLIDWQLARYNVAGLLELITTQPEES